MHDYTIHQLSQGLARKEFSSLECTNYFLNRIEKLSDINAFITVTAKHAQAQAKAADKKTRKR